jgi:hypothetical protein
MYGTYFFLGQKVDEFSYEAVNIINILENLGGFFEVFFLSLMLIP